VSPPNAAGSPPSEPVVSIVIVHYRTPELLAKCLATIEAAQIGLPHETLVIDNAPLDDAATELAERYHARHLRNERNVGYGRAINQGLAAAKGRYYLVLNPDVEIGRGAVEALTDYMEAHPAAGLCGPKLFSPDGSLQYSARTFYTLWTILLRRTFLGKLFPRARTLREHLMMDWDHNDVRDVDWMLGGALLARREAVHDVGGMDERFFLYFEDVDWCSRMHRRGWRVVYVPHAQMVHAHQRASARGLLTPGKRMHIESALRFYEKWSLILYLWKKKSTQIRALTTLASDLVLLSVAFLGAYFTRYVLGTWIPGWSTEKPVLALATYLRFIAFADLVAIGTFSFLGLYRGEVWRDRWREFMQLIKGMLITSLVVMASTFLFTTRPLSRFTILLFFPFGLVLVTIARELLRRIVAEARERQLHMRRLAVFAPIEEIERLRERFRRHGTFGFEPIYVPHDDERRHPRADAPDPVGRRIQLVEDERIAEIAVFEGAPEHAWVDHLLPRLLATGLPVNYVPRGEGLLLEARRLTDFMGFGTIAFGGRPRAVGSWMKRCADVLASAILLTIGLPFHWAQLLHLGPGAVGRRKIIGRGGRRVEMRAYRAPTGPAAAIRGLRFYPALINIFRGEMSFVGLSPLTPEQWEQADEAYRIHPPQAPVGLLAEAGGAAILLRGGEREQSGGAGVQVEQVLALNRRYIKGWSLAEDFRILLMAPRRREENQGGPA